MKNVFYIRSNEIYNDSRATKEITALFEAGYSVTVLGWDRNGTAAENCRKSFPEEISFFFYGKRLKNGIGLKNIGKLFGFFKWITHTLKANREKADIVHACDLDAGLPASKFCRKYKKKFAYDLYDYYIDCHFGIPSIARNFIEKKEIKVINSADLTLICTEERREQIAKATPKKVIVIHNSPEVEKVPDEEIVYDYAYCGSLAEMRLIGEILAEYPKYSHLKMIFAGYGPYSEKCKELAAQTEKFEYYGSVSYAEVLKKESASAVISAIYEPTLRNHRLCAPNKFYEAMALKKPVIVCRGTGIDKIVERYGIGKVINYDAAEFFAAVAYFKENPEESKRLGERARALYEKDYRWEIMKERILAAYGEL